MLIPRIKPVEDVYLPIKKANIFQTFSKIPDFPGDINIHLAEGQSVVFFRVLSKDSIYKFDTFTLSRLSVERGRAMWLFESERFGVETVGTVKSISLAHTKDTPMITVKMPTPIILQPSKHGLRALFKFRTEEDCRVMSASKFRVLTRQ